MCISILIYIFILSPIMEGKERKRIVIKITPTSLYSHLLTLFGFVRNNPHFIMKGYNDIILKYSKGCRRPKEGGYRDINSKRSYIDSN